MTFPPPPPGPTHQFGAQSPVTKKPKKPRRNRDRKEPVICLLSTHAAAQNQLTDSSDCDKGKGTYTKTDPPIAALTGRLVTDKWCSIVDTVAITGMNKDTLRKQRNAQNASLLPRKTTDVCKVVETLLHPATKRIEQTLIFGSDLVERERSLEALQK